MDSGLPVSAYCVMPVYLRAPDFIFMLEYEGEVSIRDAGISTIVIVEGLAWPVDWWSAERCLVVCQWHHALAWHEDLDEWTVKGMRRMEWNANTEDSREP